MLGIAVNTSSDGIVLHFAIAARTTAVEEDIEDMVSTSKRSSAADPNNTQRSAPRSTSANQTAPGRDGATPYSISPNPRSSRSNPQFLPIVAFLDAAVWYLRGMVFPIHCGYPTAQRGVAGAGDTREAVPSLCRLTLARGRTCYFKNRELPS